MMERDGEAAMRVCRAGGGEGAGKATEGGRGSRVDVDKVVLTELLDCFNADRIGASICSTTAGLGGRTGSCEEVVVGGSARDCRG